MIFAFTEEQEQLRAAVRRFLAEKSPETGLTPEWSPLTSCT